MMDISCCSGRSLYIFVAFHALSINGFIFFVLYCLFSYINGQLCYGCVRIMVVRIVQPSSMVVNINLYPAVCFIMYYDCNGGLFMMY